MKRRLLRSAVAALGAATVALLFSVVVGHAMSLSAVSQSLGAGSAPVSRCDTSGLTIVPTVPTFGTTVSGVTVSGIPAACGGQTVSAAVNNGTTSSTGSAVVPSGGGSVSITFTTAVAGTQTMEFDTVIGS